MKLPRKARRARVEMTPLLDIIFLVLVFFVFAVLNMTVDKSTRLSLPQSEAAGPSRLEGRSLSLEADGSMFLDRQPVSAPELLSALRSAEGRPPAVRVFAASGLDYQSLYRALDLLQSAGVTDIALQAAPQARGQAERPVEAAPSAP